MTEELRDAIVTTPVVIGGFDRGTVAQEHKIRNVTDWGTDANQHLILRRGDKELARFKDWVGIRAVAVES